MPRGFTESERAAIRETLLDAGREALRAGGVRRTPVAWFSKRAAISKGAFYLFFDGKEALVSELLLEAEAEVRAALDGVVEGPADEALRSVVHTLFHAVDDHPLLHVLADPEEMAWLQRAIGPERLAEARADDDQYFAGLWARLGERGLLAEDVDRSTLAALAPTALVLAQGEALIGERAGAVRALLEEALVRRLSPRPAASAATPG